MNHLFLYIAFPESSKRWNHQNHENICDMLKGKESHVEFLKTKLKLSDNSKMLCQTKCELFFANISKAKSDNSK